MVVAISSWMAIVVALLSASDASLTAATLQSQLDYFRAAKARSEHDDQREPWTKLQVPEPIDLLRTLPAPATTESATLAFEKAYSLTKSAAHDLLVFILFAYCQCEKSGGPEEQNAIEAGFRAANADPERVAPMLALLQSRARYSVAFRRRIVIYLLTANISTDLVLRVLSPLPGYVWRPILASYACGRQPGAWQAAVSALGPTQTFFKGFGTLSFDLAAYRALSQAEKTSEPGQALGRRLVKNLLEQGQSRIAREILQVMPEVSRSALRHEKDRDSANGGNDLRALVAAAYFEVNERKRAEDWLNAASTESTSFQKTPECSTAVAKHILTAAQNGPVESQFQLLVAARTCGPPRAHPWPSIQNGLLGKSYPDHLRELFSSVVENADKEAPDELIALLPFTKQAAADIEAGLAYQRSVATRWLATHSTAPSTAALIRSVAARRLAVPSPDVFTERRLADVSAPPLASRWRVLTEGSLKLPPGFWVVRAEDKEGQAVVLALSHRLDPTGEVSGGGYWLLFSKDGGSTWDAPIYTGLREFQPYELATASELPMLEGSAVRLEASRQELDHSRIIFPPVFVPTGPVTSGLLLVSSLEALRRDSDGDGLTDIVEERLLLDPMNADSDGDGVPDGRDSVPHISSSAQLRSRESELASEVLFRLTQAGSRRGGFQTGPSTSGSEMPEMHRVPESLEDVLYVETAGALGTERGFPVRIIVLTPDEVTAAKKRFGVFFPMHLMIFFNAEKDEALIEWDETWRGGRGRAKWHNGWEIAMEPGWIT
jgi:hypothetical protein